LTSANKVSAGLGRLRIALRKIDDALEVHDLGDGRRAIEEALREANEALAAADRGQKVVWAVVDAEPRPEPELADRVATLEERVASHERDITMLYGRTRHLDSDR
jgi:hypothetical protein